MTDTINVTAEISDFAHRVREHLGDLSPEEVDDLTDGLEADMTEAFEENPSHALPDPRTYAVELRTAAGLPVREKAAGGIRQSFLGVAESFRLKREAFVSDLRKIPMMATFLDFMIEMRPAWWLVRAWVAFQILAAIFGREGSVLPYDGLGWTLLVILVAVSVQWGRKQWLPFGWLTGLIVVGNLVAALMLVPTAALANAMTSPHYGESGDVYYGQSEDQVGVTLDGREVTNIFGYDATGKPLKGIQLFDQDGKPLRTSVEGASDCLEVSNCSDGKGLGVWIPSTLETGTKAWNVYPMQMQPAKSDDMTGELVADPMQVPENRKAPFLKVPGILVEKAPASVPEKVEKGND